MGVGGVSYPISKEVKGALGRFPNIAALVKLPAKGCSDLEIAQLLDNTHYDHIAKLLDFVGQSVCNVGEIGRHILVSKDPFQLNQALSELYLHTHLTSSNCGSVSAAKEPANHRKPDIKVRWNKLEVLMEVYNPVNLIGFQALLRYPMAILKYLDISIGFEVSIKLQSTDRTYPYQIENETDVRKWLRKFANELTKWLCSARPSHRLTVDGLSDVWQFDILLAKVHENPEIRSICFEPSTSSTDARLAFECGTETDTARSRWSGKVKSKLRKRQCGNPEADKLRILVVDFSQAWTACPDFICWPNIAERMAKVVRLLARELGGTLPYDIVLPAQLGYECCFGPMIVLDQNREAEAAAFAEAARLARPSLPREERETDWIALFSGEGPRA